MRWSNFTSVINRKTDSENNSKITVNYGENDVTSCSRDLYTYRSELGARRERKVSSAKTVIRASALRTTTRTSRTPEVRRRSQYHKC